MRIRRIVVLACAAALLLMPAGCMRDPMHFDDAYGQVVVHSMLAAGDSFATVLITKAARSMDPLGSGVSEEAVSGATVRLITSDETLTLRSGSVDRCNSDNELTGGPRTDLIAGCYSASVTDRIQPGASYALDIELPDGKRVTGSVIVPQIPVFTTPSPDDTLAIDPWADNGVLLRWRNTANALYTMVKVAAEVEPPCHIFIEVENEIPGRIVLPVTGQDSVLLVPRLGSCSYDRVANKNAEIVVTAFSTDYGEYLWARWRESRQGSHGLVGAWGIFSASASARLPAVFVRKQ